MSLDGAPALPYASPRPSLNRWAFRKAPRSRSSPGENQVVLRKRLFVLSDMLAEVTDDNLHAEQEAGPAQGNEGW